MQSGNAFQVKNIMKIRQNHCSSKLHSYLQRPSSGGNGCNSGSRKTTGSIRSTPRSTSQWRRATVRQTVSGKNTVSGGGEREGFAVVVTKKKGGGGSIRKKCCKLFTALSVGFCFMIIHRCS